MGFKIQKGLVFQVQELDFVADNSARIILFGSSLLVLELL